jgi:hypothetical protein
MGATYDLLAFQSCARKGLFKGSSRQENIQTHLFRDSLAEAAFNFHFLDFLSLS